MSHGLSKPFACDDEQPVTRVVTEAVIDLLEVVQVYKQYANVILSPGGLEQGTLHALHEQRPVWQIGQRVVERTGTKVFISSAPSPSERPQQREEQPRYNNRERDTPNR